MRREHRSVSVAVLASELCAEIRALVGASGHNVLIQTLQLRLGVDWDELMQAIAFARGRGWIAPIGPSSIRLVDDPDCRVSVPQAPAANAGRPRPHP